MRKPAALLSLFAFFDSGVSTPIQRQIQQAQCGFESVGDLAAPDRCTVVGPEEADLQHLHPRPEAIIPLNLDRRSSSPSRLTNSMT